MKRITIVVIFAIGIAHAQLNFEGNPLTEYTEYTAEESQLLSKAAKKNDTPAYLTKQSLSSPQKLYPVQGQSEHIVAKNSNPVEDELIRQSSTNNVDLAARSASTGTTSARILSDITHGQVQQPQVLQPVTNTVKTPAEIALSTFLNSKTPEESRMSLDYFLQNSQSRDSNQPATVSIGGPQNHQQQMQIVSQNDQQIQQQSLQTSSQVVGGLPSNSQINQRQQQQMVVAPVQKQVLTHPQQVFQMTGQPYGYATQYTSNSQILQPSQSIQLNPVIANQPVLRQPPFSPDSMEVLQSRSDMVSPVMWRQRNRWVRGKPYPFAAQPKIGGVFPKAPFPRKGPVELIYTKPPGYYRDIHHGPTYEDASAWFPDANGPPPATNDIYYSQLYAQSYDPHYYNYIAKTGKIKPHLYGKLGKYPEHQDGGIWAELYRGFTKHGLKNIMTPGFLLGMTLPMITVMLMALVQKRSFGRSDSRNLQEEDPLQEYIERLQRAMECYEKKRRKTVDVTTDDC